MARDLSSPLIVSTFRAPHPAVRATDDHANARAARAAGLRWVDDSRGWIRRVRAGRGFRYLAASGRPVAAATEARIRALAIPPAWRDVRICPLAHGHVQATGRDARGRKQYRYHADWAATRNATKFARMVAFGEALPRIRRRVEADLARPGLPREKVLATVVQLLERSLIRVGCEEYARTNGARGLASLHDAHVLVHGAELLFRFRGKGGRAYRVRVTDRRLARIVRRCRELPGRALFQYVDAAGTRRRIDSGDVNRYLRALAGDDFSAKDFRTWGGTLLTALALSGCTPAATAGGRKRTVLRALRLVSDTLGNTPNVCRKFYVNPSVIGEWEGGRLARRLRLPRRAPRDGMALLAAAERALLAFLKARPRAVRRAPGRARRSGARSRRAPSRGSRA
jgi:DNA topoisomerase-1